MSDLLKRTRDMYNEFLNEDLDHLKHIKGEYQEIKESNFDLTEEDEKKFLSLIEEQKKVVAKAVEIV